MKLSLLLIPLIFFMTSCTNNDRIETSTGSAQPKSHWDRLKSEQSIPTSCKKDTDCKVVTVKDCCSNSYKAINISYVSDIFYLTSDSCATVECAPTEDRRLDHTSKCVENECTIIEKEESPKVQ